MNLTPHFTLEEFTRSQTAVRKGIRNAPDENQQAHLLRLACFLETLRDRLSRCYSKELPIIISSGFRSPELNKAIGGSATSAHLKGLAADITVPGIEPHDLAAFIAEKMVDIGYDQIINEFGRWVHVGLSETQPRFQLLVAIKARRGDKWVTQYGLNGYGTTS